MSTLLCTFYLLTLSLALLMVIGCLVVTVWTLVLLTLHRIHLYCGRVLQENRRSSFCISHLSQVFKVHHFIKQSLIKKIVSNKIICKILLRELSTPGYLISILSFVMWKVMHFLVTSILNVIFLLSPWLQNTDDVTTSVQPFIPFSIITLFSKKNFFKIFQNF